MEVEAIEIVPVSTSSGFETFVSVQRYLPEQTTKMVLGCVDSLISPAGMQAFHQGVDAHPDAALILTCAPLLRDEKPTFVKLSPDGNRVIDVGRHLHEGRYVTAGWYFADRKFWRMTHDAQEAGINSMSKYLGFFCRSMASCYPIIVSEAVDIDDEQDYNLAADIFRRWNT